MSIAAQNETLAEIGGRIRVARLAAGLTLADLAGRTSLSESALSRIERGGIAVSVTNLVLICDVLGITVSDLFGSGLAPAKTAVAVHRADETGFEEVVSTGYRWRHLAGGAPQDAFNVFHLVLPERDPMKVFVSHAGQEHCYVLEGEVDFFVGTQRHRLRAGEGIMIDSTQPHRAERAGAEPARLLMIVTHAGAQGLGPEWWNAAEEPKADKAKDRRRRRTA